MCNCTNLCCFRNRSPLTVAIFGIISNVIGVALLIWGVAKIYWRANKSSMKAMKILYIIGFTSLCLSLFVFIGILVIICTNHNKCIKFFSISIIILCVIHNLLIFISTIAVLIDYSEKEVKCESISSIYHKNYCYDEDDIKKKHWISASVSGFISIILSIFVSLCANYFCFKFDEKVYNAEVISKINNGTANNTIGIFNQNIGPSNNNISIPTSSSAKPEDGKI